MITRATHPIAYVSTIDVTQWQFPKISFPNFLAFFCHRCHCYQIQNQGEGLANHNPWVSRPALKYHTESRNNYIRLRLIFFFSQTNEIPAIVIEINHFTALSSHWSFTWCRHQMETFSALLALCDGNTPFTGVFPWQRPVTQGIDVFFDLRLNKRLSEHSIRRWLRRHRAHYDITAMKPRALISWQQPGVYWCKLKLNTVCYMIPQARSSVCGMKIIL